MADVYEQNLPSKANLTVNDYMRVVGSDNNSYKQLVSDVAKKIIENYTGSSLAGSSQSVKSALDSLNSNQAYKAGDVFTARAWRAMGRATNSGKGIYCWIDLGKPIIASGATFSLGSINSFFDSGTTSPTYANTVSSVTISGNEIHFVLDTTNTLTAGRLYLIELSGTAITLT